MSDLMITRDSDGVLVVDSRLVAQELGIEHESFIKTIDKYKTQAEQAFGGLRFEIGVPDKPTGNPPEESGKAGSCVSLERRGKPTRAVLNAYNIQRFG